MGSGEKRTRPEWLPSADELETHTYSMAIPGADPTLDVLVVRMMVVVVTDTMVDFALMHQTRLHPWQPFTNAVMADASHHDEVHLHRYGRSGLADVQDPVVIFEPIEDLNDLQEGYCQAYDIIVVEWEENKRRWNDA